MRIRPLDLAGPLLLLAVRLHAPEPPAPAVDAPPRDTRRVVRFHQAPTEPDELVAPLPVTVEVAEAACGLALQPYCEPGGCAVVTRMPDLDSALGWATLSLEKPWFVVNVAARDIGMGSTPCADALADVFDGEVLPWEPDGEREVWCAVLPHGPEIQAGPLCNRAARKRLGLGSTRFETVTRRLRFTR